MTEMMTKVMLERGYKEWSWPFAYGYLTSAVGSFLAGHTSRERLTAKFAMLELEREVYSDACRSGLRPVEALRHTCGYVEHRSAETTPPAAGLGGRSPGC